MQLKILDATNTEKGTISLPAQFSEPVREDLVARAAHAIMANNRQAYGADPQAGKRHSVRVSRRRRDYRGSYGKGISRVARKVMSRSGTQFNWTGAFNPNTAGGRRAHPPKAEKVLEQKINQKESQKAIRSALAATIQTEQVKKRGHKVPHTYPFILETAFEHVSKTKEARKAFETLGLKEELTRAGQKTLRAGKGKMRNRPYRKRAGPLVVVGSTCPLMQAANGLAGVEVVLYNQLNALRLAPGAKPGRLTLFTKSAIEKLAHEKNYMKA